MGCRKPASGAKYLCDIVKLSANSLFFSMGPTSRLRPFEYLGFRQQPPAELLEIFP